jgi:hypothetical protein
VRTVVESRQSRANSIAHMELRKNNFDVSNRVDTTDSHAVNAEVVRIFLELYPDASVHVLNRSFRDMARLQLGEYPGYRACDTDYHNMQHSLDVTLAMARLMDGYERTRDRSGRACSGSASSPPCSTTSATCARSTTPGTATAPSTPSST